VKRICNEDPTVHQTPSDALISKLKNRVAEVKESRRVSQYAKLPQLAEYHVKLNPLSRVELRTKIPSNGHISTNNNDKVTDSISSSSISNSNQMQYNNVGTNIGSAILRRNLLLCRSWQSDEQGKVTFDQNIESLRGSESNTKLQTHSSSNFGAQDLSDDMVFNDITNLNNNYFDLSDDSDEDSNIILNSNLCASNASDLDNALYKLNHIDKQNVMSQKDLYENLRNLNPSLASVAEAAEELGEEFVSVVIVFGCVVKAVQILELNDFSFDMGHSNYLEGRIASLNSTDGDNNNLTLAVSINDAETKENYTHLLKALKKTATAIGLDFDTSNMVFRSDRNRGGLAAKAEQFPNANAMHCLLHLIRNCEKAIGRALNQWERALILELAVQPTKKQYEKVLMSHDRTQVNQAVLSYFLELDESNSTKWAHWNLNEKGIPLFGRVTSNPSESAMSWMLAHGIRNKDVPEIFVLFFQLLCIMTSRALSKHKYSNPDGLNRIAESHIENIQSSTYLNSYGCSTPITSKNSTTWPRGIIEKRQSISQTTTTSWTVDCNQLACSCMRPSQKKLPCIHQIVAMRDASDDIRIRFNEWKKKICGKLYNVKLIKQAWNVNVKSISIDDVDATAFIIPSSLKIRKSGRGRPISGKRIRSKFEPKSRDSRRNINRNIGSFNGPSYNNNNTVSPLDSTVLTSINNNIDKNNVIFPEDYPEAYPCCDVIEPLETNNSTSCGWNTKSYSNNSNIDKQWTIRKKLKLNSEHLPNLDRNDKTLNSTYSNKSTYPSALEAISESTKGFNEDHASLMENPRFNHHKSLYNNNCIHESPLELSEQLPQNEVMFPNQQCTHRYAFTNTSTPANYVTNMQNINGCIETRLERTRRLARDRKAKQRARKKVKNKQNKDEQ